MSSLSAFNLSLFQRSIKTTTHVAFNTLLSSSARAATPIQVHLH